MNIIFKNGDGLSPKSKFKSKVLSAMFKLHYERHNAKHSKYPSACFTNDCE